MTRWVFVRDNNVDQALKVLKDLREMKLCGHYEKPSEKKAPEKAEAIRPPDVDQLAGALESRQRK